MHRQRRRLLQLAAALLAMGCQPDFGPDRAEPNPLPTPAPQLLRFDLLCDVDGGLWSLDAEADAWTSGGRLYLGTDETIENHYVRSVSAAADGSSDSLSLELDIVGDWREQEDGASTAVRCADTPNLLFVIYDRHGDISDCLARGPDPDQLTSEDDVPDCPPGS